MALERATYRDDVDIGQPPDESRHGGKVVVNVSEKHCLIAHQDTGVEELLSGLLGDP